MASRFWLLPLCSLVAAACSSDDLTDGSGAQSPEGSQQEADALDRSSTAMPKDLRAAYIRAVQEGASESYAAATVAPGLVSMENAAQHFVAKLDGTSLSVASKEQLWSLSMRTTGVGCEGAISPVSEAKLEVEGNRSRYLREGLEEWYLNGPLGLEQGFVLSEAPACAGPKLVAMQIDGGLRARLDDADGDGRGESIRLVDEKGKVALAYSDLFVKDAGGKELSAWLTVEAGAVVIHVDDAGAAYPLVIDPLIATHQAKLLASDGAPNDFFGYSLAISGDTALVGARGDDDNGTDAGAAYVFVRSNGVWAQQQKLLASDGAAADDFGISVALSGDTALVGAYKDDDKGQDSGSAYVFVRSGGVWTQQQKLLASDGAADDLFSLSVALSGDTALVGAPSDDDSGQGSGSVYVFARSGTVWSEQQKLIASDGTANHNFGISVALSQDTALVGASGDSAAGPATGSAYVFIQNGAVWSQQQKLLATDGAENDWFGRSVAVSGDTALVGALFDENGSAYVFTRSSGFWTQQQKLVPSDWIHAAFGYSVALSGSTALIGALINNEGPSFGSAYVFTNNGASWAEQQKLAEGNVYDDDYFGASVALSGDTALVGAFLDDDNGANSGAIHVYRLALTQGSPCNADTECTSGFCVDGVCCDTTCGGGVSSDCQACSIAAGASADGTCAPVAAGTECRSAAHACDAAETCDGQSILCPGDELAPDGTSCEPGMCTSGTCALYDVIALAGGGNHTLALRASGDVLAWGSDTNGQLGNGTSGSSSTPTTISGLPPIMTVAAGGTHSLALDYNGEMWAWGADTYGQLGNGTSSGSSQIPMKIELPGLPLMTAIAAGANHSLAIDDNGQVWAWGADTYGKLGNGGTSQNSQVPTLVSGLPYIMAISAGRNHSLALDADGNVWSWGHDAFGQLGNGGTAVNSQIPVSVVNLSGVYAIAAGGDHNMALLYDGTVWTWGRDGVGQLGNGGGSLNTQSPAQVPNLFDVYMIAGGGDHSLATLYDGTVWAWGHDGFGQLGDGAPGSSKQSPVQVINLNGAQSIAAGNMHSFALLYDFTLWAWGAGTQGQLGNGASSNQFAPVSSGLL